MEIKKQENKSLLYTVERRVIRNAFYSLAVSALAVLATSSNSNAGIALVGSLNDSTLNYTTAGIGVNPDRKWTVGGGILLDTSFTAPFSIQLGALYTPLESPAGNEVNYIQVPATLRFELIPYLTISGGVYYSFRLSNVDQPSGVLGFSSDSSSNDWGLLAGLGTDLPLGNGNSVLVEANYNWGLKNQSNDPYTTAKWQFIQILAGLRFGSK